MRGNPNFDRIKAVIDKLLTGDINQKREFFIFKKLFKLYPDWEYWQQLTPDKTTNSLAWYFSKWGDPYLKKQWMIHKKTKIENPVIESETDDLFDRNSKNETIEIKEKKKSLIDLLS